MFFRIREWNARVTANERPVPAGARAGIRRMRTRALCDYMSFYVLETNEYEEGLGEPGNIFNDLVVMSDSDTTDSLTASSSSSL